ncbi:NAD binding Rossmann fold oxidoreductase [Metarhizium acridum CQMa 102]|uniref:NAD binding Rossmann fold oxidoreductase n=1 Tax=Metarhizium acridum (strain CQMa 102) TaxID=655827 RepID=E9E6T4_METAQ|nr:NAD binding Rossmann fold oxidoreductase [Metarhizium acridum CQMa 102]EFY88373.1 NAD binding Rossmann fold oxidoreductase [Metarhizium acridum CQMa 102]
MASKSFNVGVIGYGEGGKRSLSAKVFHIPFIATTPQLRLHSIVQRSPRDGNSAPQDHPSAKHYTDAKQLLSDGEVDVVVVTTPPDTHFALTKAALETGKHVLTEKPFVPTAAEAEQLMAAARQSGRLVCVYQNRRWDADFLLVRHLVASGAVGRVVELDSHFDRYRAAPPPAGGWKEDQLKAGVKPTAAGFGREDPGRMRLVRVADDGAIREEKVPDLEPETYRAFYAAFARALETGREEDLPVKASEARDVLRIIEAVVESAKTGRDVVFS